jgi:hypothetical protein
MTYVGEDWPDTISAPPPNTQHAAGPGHGERPPDAEDDHRGIGLKGSRWLKQAGVTPDQLDTVFNFTPDSVDLLVMAGKNKKEMTLNTYVLFGTSQYLRSGSLTFADSEARKACVAVGCFDQANHATTIKDRGNLFSGDKDGGWTLSTAGLARAAILIKQYQDSAA